MPRSYSNHGFKPRNQHGRQTQFQKGKSGCPGGKSGLQKEFEDNFYAAIFEPQLVTVAIEKLRAAVERGEQWALHLYFSKARPTQPVKLEVSRGGFDGAELARALLEALGPWPEARIAAAACLFGMKAEPLQIETGDDDRTC